MEPTEQEAATGRVWGWVIVILVAALVLAWGLASFFLIPDVKRQWHFGALPDTPGESVYSTGATPQESPPPRQFPALPEAQSKTDTGGRP
jgi:hypothetical protein